jgi:hypothetical protein
MGLMRVLVLRWERVQFVWDSLTVTFGPACLGILILDIENSGLWRYDIVSQG